MLENVTHFLRCIDPIALVEHSRARLSLSREIAILLSSSSSIQSEEHTNECPSRPVPLDTS